MKHKPVKWTTKKKRISLCIRESTLKALDLLDKNEYHTKTYVFETAVEKFLIKKGLLEPPG